MAGSVQVQPHKASLGLWQAVAQVGSDKATCCRRFIDKKGSSSATAQSLDAPNSGTSEQIQHHGSTNSLIANDIEQRFSNPSTGGTEHMLAGLGAEQPSSFGLTTGNAHSCLSVWLVLFSRPGLAQFP